MSNTIKRTLTESTINAYSVVTAENGEPSLSKLEPVTVHGKITKEKALKEIKKIYPEATALTITSILENEVMYEISIEDFIKNAKKIENTVKKEND